MDEKGFIFTTDAVLALVVVIVLAGSIVTYGLLPIYQGENHQHLEALADSALETMEQSGALREAAVEYKSNSTTAQADAEATLRSSLETVIPSNVGYRLTMDDNTPVQDDNGVFSSNDVVTKVKVISGPQEGWMGRAYYKQDEVQFEDIHGTATTTLWNFHNYLSNFVPWKTNGLIKDNFWGGTNVASGQTSIPINFSAPGPVNSAQFVMGSAAGMNGTPRTAVPLTKSYGANVKINGVNNNIVNTSFIPLYTSTGQGLIFNNRTVLNPTTINNGLNSFYIQYNATFVNQTMPWFSILANYNTVISVPKGIANITIPFTDVAGIGRPGPGNTGILYNLDTGTTTPTVGKSISWGTLQSDNFATDVSTPFELTNIPNTNGGSNGVGSAVASVQTITLPPGNRLFDAFTVVNAYGGEDGAIVQVQDSTGTISTAFASFTNTSRNDGGYGFVPGTVNIQPYLQPGINKVRIITWDNSNGGDYDLVGLESCYSKITYSKLPIRWDTISFNNYQNSSSNKVTTETQTKTFRIDPDAQSALLFVGVGLATRNMTVTVKNTVTGATSLLYPANSPIPYVINLGELDAAPTQSTHILTSIVGNGSSLKSGNYTLTVTVTPSLAYESGDGASSPNSYGYTGDPSMFSGTRISVIYPKFLQNVWATGFANNPQDASKNAIDNLTATLSAYGYYVNNSLIRNTTLYSGEVPNAIPVRLELWTQ